MEVFRHARTKLALRELIAAVDRAAATPAPDRPLRQLLAMGRLECALADAWSVECDDIGLGRTRLLEATLALARYHLACREGRAGRSPWPALAAGLAAWLTDGDRVLEAGAAEGFRFHGLEPGAYATAARTWHRAAPGAEPVWTIGLRTIGSVLAPVVAAALSARGVRVRLASVRPRGEPFDRRPRLSARMREALAQWPGAFAIVDEGPGLSGSSFGGMVRQLRELGVPNRRIALFASWECDPARLHSAYAARHWNDWQVLAAPPLRSPVAHAADCGGGQWRRRLRVHADVPVLARHERPKFLAGVWLWKFAGLGDYGREAYARAQAMCRAGFGPPLARDAAAGGMGWIAWRRLNSLPLPSRFDPAEGRRFADFAGRYLAWIEANYLLARREPPSRELRHMAETNGRELGLPNLPPAPEGPLVALDGRVLPHEWGRHRGEFVKFDGTDHADDHFFPGPADIAWDLAAMRVEFGHALGEAITDAYRRGSGARQADLARRLQWYGSAYRRFRIAWCRFAATQSALPDSARFVQSAAGYAAAETNTAKTNRIVRPPSASRLIG